MSNYRYEQAEQCLSSARTLIGTADFKGAANRSYYAIFHAMRSILALQNCDFGKHTAVISHFRKNFIKTGIFSVEMSDIIENLFTVRNKCDYDDFYIISKEDVVAQLISAVISAQWVNDSIANITFLKCVSYLFSHDISVHQISCFRTATMISFC